MRDLIRLFRPLDRPPILGVLGSILLFAPSAWSMSGPIPRVLPYGKHMNIEEFKVDNVVCSFDFFHKRDALGQIWSGIVKKAEERGEKIWDGQYYRVENFDELNSGSKTIKLSIMRYSTIRSLIEYRKGNELDPKDYSYHVNTGALIRTKEGLYVFGVKKSGTRVYYDLVGGGLQPNELQVRSGADVWTNMLKEMNEEVNLVEEDIASKSIAGIVLADNMSVIVVFDVVLNKTLQEVEQIFAERQDFELSHLRGIPPFAVRSFLKRQGGYFPELAELLGPASKL